MKNVKNILTIAEYINRIDNLFSSDIIKHKNITQSIQIELDHIKKYINLTHKYINFNDKIIETALFDKIKRLNKIKSFNFEYLDIHNKNKKFKAQLFEIEGGKLLLLNPINSIDNTPTIYLDKKFVDSNFFKSFNSIGKFNI